MKKTMRVLMTGMLCLLLLTGCGMFRFIATGEEFSQICRDSGLTVEDVKEHYSADLNYQSVRDAYMASDPDGKYVIQYVRFGNLAEAETFYTESAANMSGTETVTREYSVKSEEIDGKSRRLLMENGRVLYAEGDTQAINDKIAALTAGWEQELQTGQQDRQGGQDAAGPASKAQGPQTAE